MSIWDMIQAYRDATGASEAWIMRKAGLNKGAFTAWRARGVPALPERRVLLNLAETLRVNYEDLVMAMLTEAKYIPEAAAREDERRLDAERRARYAWEDKVHRYLDNLITESNHDAVRARELNSEYYRSDKVDLGLWEAADDALESILRTMSAESDNVSLATAADQDADPDLMAGEQEESDTP